MDYVIRANMNLVCPVSFMDLLTTFMHYPILEAGDFTLIQVSAKIDLTICSWLIIQRSPVCLQLFYARRMIFCSKIKDPCDKFSPALCICGLYSGNFGKGFAPGALYFPQVQKRINAKNGVSKRMFLPAGFRCVLLNIIFRMNRTNQFGKVSFSHRFLVP